MPYWRITSRTSCGGILEYYKLATALFVDTTVYFVAMAVGLSFWAEYAVAFLDEEKEKSAFGHGLVYAGRTIAVAIFLLSGKYRAFEVRRH